MDPLLRHIKGIKERQSKKPFTKEGLEGFLENTLSLAKLRSVFTCATHSFRVSKVRGNTRGFSNVVLSLSALLKYDDRPFVVIVVREGALQFLLSNTTFLKKISHSSHTLTLDNIKGSFLGQDIFQQYEGVPNDETNFEVLFDTHRQTSKSWNIQRLVAATNSIEGRQTYFNVSEREARSILNSPQRYKGFVESREFVALADKLDQKISHHRDEILGVATRDGNINTRRNTIEQIITNGINEHKTEDIIFSLSDGSDVLIDIKTKLKHLSSSPKAFNIDKTLKVLSNQNQFFCFFLLVIDIGEKNIVSSLVSVLSEDLINRILVQRHWAGRNSRGSTQISGDINELVENQNASRVNLVKADNFLKKLIEIKV